ncbi:CRISPR-associated protein Csd1 [Pseudoxanthobacter soli DSM 19599]|uniref:CRISPR-associated protein Csd1 n=1 Tax=Pseudoxanthobacter soli DSM 19599 TaxID=1123029 RepID=A0A1M7ZMG7_9HYPH|nr:type I-C CRISPR-associated protein Cas8c/Csd1 [Pseudoxanthobacter soli]SHO66009.1 CRISPR-associated protein Csd1 [Pseudoxanthobacter soli DSM 19599]
MSILSSLVQAYERLPDAPPFGFSVEKIGFLISLNEDGSVAHVVDLRDGAGKKKVARLLPVPASFKRPGITPRSFFLWDNTAYVLGVSANEAKGAEARHQAFYDLHMELLEETDDEGLIALRNFISAWSPDDFVKLGWPEEMKDQNIVFALERERRDRLLHQREAAKAIWERRFADGERTQAVCLVTGQVAPIARLHPAIKGVWGGQVAGGSIVSFNLDAFTSYGHEQGDNAPVSEAAAFAYTTALNRFLERDSGHRIQIGDASVVFWADASDIAAASEAESLFAAFIDPGAEDAAASKTVGIQLARIRAGEHLAQVAPDLEAGVRFYVLGLAPNAARLSIRFFFEDSFGALTRNYQRFVSDMHIEPAPRDGYPPLWRYLRETALLGKSENVPPNLAGEWMRSVLGGTRYPLTLLATVLTRVRADGEVNALRTGILKAILVRNYNREAPVALDPSNRDRGYLLGRLFAAYEQAQNAALGGKVNATIKDKFYGSASAQPRKVFSLLDKGSANHLSKVGKQSPGRRVNLEKVIGGIMEAMEPGDDPFPPTLSAEEQALFGLGYYHQRNEFFKKPVDAADTGETAE